MSLLKLDDYDDMPTFVASDVVSFMSAAGRGEVLNNLSMAFVLGDVTRESISAVARVTSSLSPTLVHCFGQSSELAHDAMDAALWNDGYTGIPTAWTLECDPIEVIFELFCTDLPAEADIERWSGRLLILASDLPNAIREGILTGLRDIHATVQRAVRGGDKWFGP